MLLSIFKSNAVGIEEFPEHVDHCILCGEWENRRIIWTGNTGAFDHEGSGIPICEKCILDESEE
ncbi:hypothetical protein RV18_GL003257 [Enterococcus termitis]|nr:hypothetical protein RV18_GL003257 [Enterococcus termitis]